MVEEKILDRIKKCLELSNSDNSNEAGVALAMAQKLMAQYGVDQRTLEMSDVTHVDVKSPFSVSKPKDYELTLAVAVAKAFGFVAMWVPAKSQWHDNSGRFRLVGPKVSADVVEYVALVLLRKLRNARSEFNSRLSPLMSKESKAKYLNGFCVGWSTAIYQKVAEFAGDENAAEVRAKEYANSKFNVNDKETVGKKSDISTIGMSYGYEAGGKESIHRPMASRAPDLKISHEG